MNTPTYSPPSSPLPPPVHSEIAASGPMLLTLHDWFLGQALQGAQIPINEGSTRLLREFAPVYANLAADPMMFARVQAGSQPAYMTRRDWLAGMALPGLAAVTYGSPEGIAALAYQLADTAIEEQTKRESAGC